MKAITKEELRGIFYVNINGNIKQAKIDSIRFLDKYCYLIGIRVPNGDILFADAGGPYEHKMIWCNRTLKNYSRVLYKTKDDAALFNENYISWDSIKEAVLPIYEECLSSLSKAFEFDDGGHIMVYWIDNGGIERTCAARVEIQLTKDGYKTRFAIFNKKVIEGEPTEDMKSMVEVLTNKGYFFKYETAQKHILSQIECECFEGEETEEEEEETRSERVRRNLHQLIDEAEGESLTYIAKIIAS